MNPQHEGIVQLGDLTAHATWTDGQFLSIRFSTGAISRVQWHAIDQLRSRPNPVLLVCDGTAKGQYQIVGHESDSGSVTFHLSASSSK